MSTTGRKGKEENKEEGKRLRAAFAGEADNKGMACDESRGRKVGEEESVPQYIRGHWRPSEDDKLKQLVARHGPQNWNLIAQHLHGRSGKSCRLRWFNQLDPRINRAAFSAEEERRLVAAHRFYGNKWACIARLFPGRTDNAVKNHWHVIKARHSRQQHLQQISAHHVPSSTSRLSSSSPLASSWPPMQQRSVPSSLVQASSTQQLEVEASKEGADLKRRKACWEKGEEKVVGQKQDQFRLPIMLPRRYQIGEKLYETRITMEKIDQTCKSWHSCDSKVSDQATSFSRNYHQSGSKSSHSIEDFDHRNNENLIKEVPFIDFLGVGRA